MNLIGTVDSSKVVFNGVDRERLFYEFCRAAADAGNGSLLRQ